MNVSQNHSGFIGSDVMIPKIVDFTNMFLFLIYELYQDLA